MGKTETAVDALERLAAWLKAEDKESKLVFSKPMTAKQVAGAEKLLEVKLPPGYVALVTTRGAFKLRNAGEDSMALVKPQDLKGKDAKRGRGRTFDEHIRAWVDGIIDDELVD